MSKVAHKAHGSMKQAGTKVNQLVERLQQWAVEMDLSEDQLPTNNSLKMLVAVVKLLCVIFSVA